MTLNNQIISKNKNILVHDISSIIEDTFLENNYKLQTSDNIDTTFSGSTCVSLIYTPEKVTCANVGDSRAVIGKFVNGGKNILKYNIIYSLGEL
jgi:serine/threonine protein phosphatase PrpC